jgi:ABC-type antimicrobial peptide transport system permease subunit
LDPPKLQQTSSTLCLISVRHFAYGATYVSVVAIIGVLLSFFVLLLSFTANIRENSWELGVLRAIGLNVRIFAKSIE